MVSDELQQHVGELLSRRRILLAGRDRPQSRSAGAGAQVVSDLLSAGARPSIHASASDLSGGWARRAMAAVTFAMVASSGMAFADTHGRPGPAKTPEEIAAEFTARVYEQAGRVPAPTVAARASSLKTPASLEAFRPAHGAKEGVATPIPVGSSAKHDVRQPGAPNAEWKSRTAALDSLPKVGADSKANPAALLAKVADLSPVTVKIDGKTYEALNPLERIRLCKEVAADTKLNQHGLDWRNIYATVHAETGWAERTGMGLNGKPSFGLAQMEAATARSLGIDPTDPKASLVGVAMLLKEASAWAKAKGHENKSAAISIYYNLSSKARNSWDGVTLDNLPQPTKNHIKNMSDGLKMATHLAPKYEKLIQQAKAIEREEAKAAQARAATERAVSAVAAGSVSAAPRPAVSAVDAHKADRAEPSSALEEFARGVSQRLQRVFGGDNAIKKGARGTSPDGGAQVSQFVPPADASNRRDAIATLVSQRASMADILERISGSARNGFQQFALREQAEMVRQAHNSREDYKMMAG